MSEIRNLKWLEMKTCKVCGKKFSVLYPELWAYKEGHPQRRIWYCSWHCLRAARPDEKKKGDIVPMEKVRRDRLKLVMELIEKIEAGEDPVDYLESLGYAGPLQTYSDLKKWARQNQPALAEKFPKRRTPKKEAPKVELVYDPSIEEEYRREQAQKEENAKAAAESRAREEEEEMAEMPGAEDVVIKEEDFFLVTAVKNKNLGEFYYDHDHNCIDWRNGIGDEVSLGVEGWKLMVRKLPGILRYLGVDF